MASSMNKKDDGEDEDESYNDDAFDEEYLDDEFAPSKKTDGKEKSSVGKQEKANSIISKQSSGPKLGSIGGSRATLDS